MEESSSSSRFPKRERKQKVFYQPDETKPSNRSRSSLQPKEKNRNTAIDSKTENKWKKYYNLIKKTLNVLLHEMHNLEVNFEGKTALPRGKNALWEQERTKCEKKIFLAKQTIVATLKAIASENADHTRWPQLSEDYVPSDGEDDMISVDEIYCSVCGKEETDVNDIFFCDSKGCCRAYHQLCLDPPLSSTDIDSEADWFCWQCECMDDCLDVISERLGEDYYDWNKVFPEVNNVDSFEEAQENGETLATALLPDDEEDEEYDPEAEDEEEGEQLDDVNESDRQTNIQTRDIASENQNKAEDEDGSDDEDENEDEFSDEEEEDDSDIDEDELQGLLEDANIPYEETLYAAQEEEVPIARRLRERKPQKQDSIIKLEGKEDIGKFVARVRRGVFQLGKIIEYLPSSSSSSSSSQPENKEENINFSPSKEAGHDQWKVSFSREYSDDGESDEEETNEKEDDQSDADHEESMENKTEEASKPAKKDKYEEEILLFDATKTM
jgi:hypothetical protein